MTYIIFYILHSCNILLLHLDSCFAFCSFSVSGIYIFVFLRVSQAKQSLATLTKDVPKRQSLIMAAEPVVNGSQEWVMQADLPLTAAIRQSQQTLYHGHITDRQGRRSPPLGLSVVHALTASAY